MQTHNCDQCENFVAEEQTFEGKWTARVGVCLLGHKPRFYAPKTMLDSTWGYKRKCADYTPEGVGKREHIMDASCWCHPELNYKDPDNDAEVWVHKEPT